MPTFCRTAWFTSEIVLLTNILFYSNNRIIFFCYRFVIMFDGLKVYCNDERTRTFIGLKIKTGYDSLLNIVEMLDECLKEYNLPTFYKVIIRLVNLN